MTEVSEEAEAIAGAIGEHITAQTCLMTALIDVLMRHGVLSSETIRRELFEELRTIALQPADIINHTSSELDNTLINLVDRIEHILFDNRD
jgi:hypothetical protein